MNYEEMSDFEINGYVSMHMHGFSWIEFVDGCSSHVKCGNERSPGFAMIEVSDYCNNPSYAWPIIVSMISGGCIVQMLKAGVIVTLQGGGRIQVMDKNPLRVAMIVFLMMQEQAK
ncbi:MAG: phage protein NinX family protein [Aeromonadaceae bacterium]